MFVIKLEADNAPLSFIATVKPAIDFLEQSLDKATSFTPSVLLLLEGARRRAEQRRPPRQKAPTVTRSDVATVLRHHYLPHAADPRAINKVRLRTIFRMVLVYHTACRLDCFSRLMARDFDLLDDDILITFKSAKNDQHHNGNRSVLSSSASPFCPVTITKAFFRVFGFRFGLAGGDTSHVSCRIRCGAGHRLTILPHSTVSYSGATADLRKLFSSAGIHKQVTDKSIKMLAVTTAFASGGSSEQVMHLGRWASISTPEHYKHNSTDFKLSVSSLVPALLPL